QVFSGPALLRHGGVVEGDVTDVVHQGGELDVLHLFGAQAQVLGHGDGEGGGPVGVAVEVEAGHLGYLSEGADRLPIGDLGLLEAPERAVGEAVGKEGDGQRPPSDRRVHHPEEPTGGDERDEDVQVSEPGQGDEPWRYAPVVGGSSRPERQVDSDPDHSPYNEGEQFIPSRRPERPVDEAAQPTEGDHESTKAKELTTRIQKCPANGSSPNELRHCDEDATKNERG